MMKNAAVPLWKSKTISVWLKIAQKYLMIFIAEMYSSNFILIRF